MVKEVKSGRMKAKGGWGVGKSSIQAEEQCSRCAIQQTVLYTFPSVFLCNKSPFIWSMCKLFVFVRVVYITLLVLFLTELC